MSPDAHDRPSLDPDAIARQSFTKVRRGYEADEVRAYLMGLASQIRESGLRQADLERRLAEVERRAADPRELDADSVTQLLGEETARVLETARKAAAEIRSRAEEDSAAQLADAEARSRSAREAADQYATGVRTSTDETVARLRAEADAYALEVRTAADRDTAEQRTAADAYVEQVRSEVDEELSTLRAQTHAEVERMRSEAGSVLAERTAEAETAASAIQAEADAYANRVRSDADRYSEATRAAADSYRSDVQGAADAYRADATAEGDRVRNEARAEADRTRADAEQRFETRSAEAEAQAEAILEEARTQGRGMVEEARAYRERVIADLTDRRRSLRSDLDHLLATRDALAVALSDVAAKANESHASLRDAVASAEAELGDAAGDRAYLESMDRPAPSLAPTPAEPVPGGGDAGTAGGEDEAEGSGSGDGEPSAAPTVDEEVESAAALADDEFEEPTAPVAVVTPETVPALVEPVAEADANAAMVAEEAAAEDAAAEGEPADGDDEAGDGTVVTGDPAAAIFDRLRAGSAPGDEAAEPADAAPGPGVDADADAAVASEAAADESAAPGATADASDPTDGDAGDQGGDGGDGDDEKAVDPDVDLLDRRDAATDEVEKALARKVKRVLSDEQNETLDRLRRTKGAPALDDVLPSTSEHHERYRVAALDELAAAERAGAGFFGAAPKRKADVYDVAGALATEIQGQIRSRLERAVADGGDEQEISERIRACYREWKTQRIADTAGHFVVVAFNRGIAEAAADGTEFRWLVDDGDQQCPDCDDNALGGRVRKGEPFPTGDLCPPAHPGCRCLAVPVVDQ